MRSPLRAVVRRSVGPSGAEARLALRGRLAGAGLVVVLLAMGVFAVATSYWTGAAARDAIDASTLSDDYEAAADAIYAQEKWEREYRLQPSAEVEMRFDHAAVRFASAMRRVDRDGDPADAALAERALLDHGVYVRAVERLFRAHDRGDQAAVARIDEQVAGPTIDRIEEPVSAASVEAHTRSLAHLDRLGALQERSGVLTPTVFLVGLVIATVLALVTREYRRVLMAERARAVHDSLHDPLSGLPNRTLLHERLEHALREDRGAGSTTGLLLIDLDRFKDINDTFGHQYGDALLRQVGSRLTGVVREQDTVARLGGDEFAVVLPAVASLARALEVAHRVREAFEPSFRVFGVDLNVGASVGVVLSGKHGRDPSTLLQRADIAMYVAKTEGVGAFAYSPDIDTHSPTRLALLGELREALIRNHLILHYQPQVAVDTGELVAIEALVRWQHPTHGLLPPTEFIPLAEHTELIGPLTRYVLEHALAQQRRWADRGRALPLSVNLSARNLLDPGLPELVAELLETHRVPPELLVLEVTESALMGDPVRAGKVLQQLAAYGVRLSIDDFGAGYTSLSQLKTLPVHELKIDRTFVTTMSEDRTNALIVESVIELGHNLGLSIVAEGVEDERALAALREMGCDLAQGFHFSRPVPARQLDVWRSAHRAAHPARVQQTPAG